MFTLRNVYLKNKPFLVFIFFEDNFDINNVMVRNILAMQLFIYYYKLNIILLLFLF